MKLDDRGGETAQLDGLTIAGKTYRSRLLVGSGKFYMILITNPFL